MALGCCSAEESEKLQPLAVGKFETLCCIKDLKNGCTLEYACNQNSIAYCEEKLSKRNGMQRQEYSVAAYPV
jgi:hypothetical protein